MTDHTLTCNAGCELDTVLGYTLEPPFVAEQDGRYLALLNDEKKTARLQYVGPILPPVPDPEYCPTCGHEL